MPLLYQLANTLNKLRLLKTHKVRVSFGGQSSHLEMEKLCVWSKYK